MARDRLLKARFKIGTETHTFYGATIKEATANANAWAKKHGLTAKQVKS
jgi:hypothetical protein